MKTMLRVFACLLIFGNCIVGAQVKADAGSEQLIKLEAEFAKTTAEKGFD